MPDVYGPKKGGRYELIDYTKAGYSRVRVLREGKRTIYHAKDKREYSMTKRLLVVAMNQVGGPVFFVECGFEFMVGDRVLSRPSRGKRVLYHAKCARRLCII